MNKLIEFKRCVTSDCVIFGGSVTSRLVLALSTEILALDGFFHPWPAKKVAWNLIFDGSLGSGEVILGKLLLLSENSEPCVLNTEHVATPVANLPVGVISTDDSPASGVVTAVHGKLAVGALGAVENAWW